MGEKRLKLATIGSQGKTPLDMTEGQKGEDSQMLKKLLRQHDGHE